MERKRLDSLYKQLERILVPNHMPETLKTQKWREILENGVSNVIFRDCCYALIEEIIHWKYLLSTSTAPITFRKNEEPAEALFMEDLTSFLKFNDCPYLEEIDGITNLNQKIQLMEYLSGEVITERMLTGKSYQQKFIQYSNSKEKILPIISNTCAQLGITSSNIIEQLQLATQKIEGLLKDLPSDYLTPLIPRDLNDEQLKSLESFNNKLFGEYRTRRLRMITQFKSTTDSFFLSTKLSPLLRASYIGADMLLLKGKIEKVIESSNVDPKISMFNLYNARDYLIFDSLTPTSSTGNPHIRSFVKEVVLQSISSGNVPAKIKSKKKKKKKNLVDLDELEGSSLPSSSSLKEDEDDEDEDKDNQDDDNEDEQPENENYNREVKQKEDVPKKEKKEVETNFENDTKQKKLKKQEHKKVKREQRKEKKLQKLHENQNKKDDSDEPEELTTTTAIATTTPITSEEISSKKSKKKKDKLIMDVSESIQYNSSDVIDDGGGWEQVPTKKH